MQAEQLELLAELARAREHVLDEMSRLRFAEHRAARAPWFGVVFSGAIVDVRSATVDLLLGEGIPLR